MLAAWILSGCSPAPEDRELADTPAPQAETAAIALPTEAFRGDLDQIRERKILRALVVPSNTDFFLSGAMAVFACLQDLLDDCLRTLVDFIVNPPEVLTDNTQHDNDQPEQKSDQGDRRGETAHGNLSQQCKNSHVGAV